MKDILDLIALDPSSIWLIALIGAVCVVGVVDYLRCFFEQNKKHIVRWVVLAMSIFVGVILSPAVPSKFSIVVIFILLVLALASIGKKALIDGIPKLIDKMVGSASKEIK